MNRYPPPAFTNMSRSVLISFSESNKKVVIPSVTHVNDLEYLRRICLTKFNFQSSPNVRIELTLQKYDTDWETFVDLDDDYIAEDRDKLKLLVSPSLTDAFSGASESGSTCTVPLVGEVS